MNKFDFIAQTIIIVVTLLIYSAGGNLSSTVVLAGLACLGVWQMVSCIVSVICKSPYHELKQWHLGLSIVYLVVFYVYENTPITGDGDVGPMYSLRNFLPLVLAVYYYTLTCMWCFGGKVV